MLRVLAYEEKCSQNINSRLRQLKDHCSNEQNNAACSNLLQFSTGMHSKLTVVLFFKCVWLIRGNPVNNTVHFAVGFVDCAMITWQASVYTDQEFAKAYSRCSILRWAVDGIWYAVCVFELDLSSSTIVSLCTGLHGLLGWTEAGQNHPSLWQPGEKTRGDL